MVPAAGQGIIGITAREEDVDLRELLAGIEDPAARTAADAERALLAALDGSCRTPIGAYARPLPDGTVHLTGLVARADGSSCCGGIFRRWRRMRGAWETNSAAGCAPIHPLTSSSDQ